MSDAKRQRRYLNLGYRGCRLTPTLMAGRAKPPMRPTADQMPLNIECVVDRRMNRNKALSRFGRFEALHLSFSSSNWLMRVLRAVVGAQALLMESRKANFAKRSSIRVLKPPWKCAYSGDRHWNCNVADDQFGTSAV